MKTTNYVPVSGDLTPEVGDEEILGIDPENMAMALSQFYTYQNPVPSIVREVTSNALDAHAEAEAYGKMTAEEIVASGWTDYLPSEQRLPYAQEMADHFTLWEKKNVRVSIIPGESALDEAALFQVEDWGVGLSPSRVKKIYAKFFSSTKRGTNAQIGAFGLGAKSPLGYTDSFYIRTRYMGIEYYYTIYKGDRGPTIKPMGQSPTDLPNGTLVQVTIKSGDEETFQKAVDTQLSYFDHVEFVGCNITAGQIVQGNKFIYRDGSPFSEMHLCIGKVYYPLDTFSVGAREELGWNRIPHTPVPIGLRFSVDEVTKDEEEGKLSILWNREGIQYNEETKKVIVARYLEAKNEIVEIYKKKAKATSSFKEFIELVTQKKEREIEIAPGVIITNAKTLVNPDPEYPKYGALKSLPTSDLLFTWYCNAEVRYGSKSQSHRYLTTSWNNNDKVYLLGPGDRYSVRKNKFLDYEGQSLFYLAKKRDLSQSEINRAFGYSMANPPSDDEQILIDSFVQEIDDFLEETYTYYNDVEFTESFLDHEAAEKAAKKDKKVGRLKRQRTDDQFPIKYLTREENEWKWTMADMYEHEAEDYRSGLTIYGATAEEEMLFQFAPILFHNRNFFLDWSQLDFKRARILKISEANKKYFKDNPNAIFVMDLLEHGHRVLTRHVTAYLISKTMGESIAPLLNSAILNSAPQIYKSAKFLTDYIATYHMARSSTPFMDETLLQDLRKRDRDRKVAHRKRVAQWKAGGKRGPIPVLRKTDLYDREAIDHMGRLQAFLQAFPLVKAIDPQRVDTQDVMSYITLHGQAAPELATRFVNRKP